MDEHNKITIDLGGEKIFVLKLSEFDQEIDVEDLLKTSHHNVLGEVLTFSALFNRIGNMKAEMDSLVAHSKMDLEVYEAQVAELYRLNANNIQIDLKGVPKGKKPTEKEIENTVLTDDDVIARKKKHLNLLKQQGYVDSLYWSAKDKSDKLNKLSEKLRPEEFEKELIEDTINGILIKQRNKMIK